MGKSARACLFLSAWLLAASSHASEGPGWNLGIKSGVVQGSIQSTMVDPDVPAATITQKVTYGGLPFAVTAAFPAASWLTLTPALGIVWDLNLNEVTRRGIELGSEFHIIGKAHGYSEPTGSRTTHTLSAIARLGMQVYSAPTHLVSNDFGGIVETSFGMSYRIGFGQSASLAFNLVGTPGGLSTGSSNFNPRLFSGELDWRFFL